MKTRTLAAALLAATTLALLACNWFGKKEATPSIIGKWKVTNVIDSSATGLTGISIFHGFNADTSNVSITFGLDSILILTSAEKPANDTAKYFTDSSYHTIVVKGDTGSKADSYAVKNLNDTLLEVMKDSVYFQLKRLP